MADIVSGKLCATHYPHSGRELASPCSRWQRSISATVDGGEPARTSSSDAADSRLAKAE